MVIKQIVDKYINQGHSFYNAQNLAAEEIVLRKIASSPLSELVTLKGGIVMYNLTKSDRRVTRDIDFDFIRYSISEDSIRLFVEKLDSVNDGITTSIEGKIEALHQDEYQGVRIHLLLKDEENNKLRIKMDIGVHTNLFIEQNRIVFSFDNTSHDISIKVNSCEQIASEKLISLAKLGPISTRYKDIYDIYYLIENNLVDRNDVAKILNAFVRSNTRGLSSLDDIKKRIISTLNDPKFAIDAKNPASKWLDADYEIITGSIIKFLNNM